MMVRDDLRAAVSAGIIGEAQAAALLSLSQSRQGARENLNPGDEPFELFKGFNEIFIVVGLMILTLGWVGFASLSLVGPPTDVRSDQLMAGALGSGILWLLAEYFIRRRRMVAPAIALSILFAGHAGYALFWGFAEVFMIAQGDNSSLALPLALTVLALLIFWLRFKVPFALALIAFGAFTLSILVAGLQAGTPETLNELFLLSADGPFAWITLALGIIVFAIAMAFDMSDPHRVTRRASNGFWLHIIAAPALVNTLALSLLAIDSLWAQISLMAVLALFALVAIIIDRRSFLIAAIGYTVFLTSTLFDTSSAVGTIIGLGLVLLFLGARWEAIRARLLRLLPNAFPKDRLPPSFSTKDAT